MSSITKYLFASLLLIANFSLKAQCPDDNVWSGDPNVSVGCPGSTTVTLDAGEYINVDVVAGNIYTITTCTAGNTCNSNLTLADLGTLTSYATNNDGGTAVNGCSEIVWTSTVTGSLSLLLDRYQNAGNQCQNTGCLGTSISISCAQPPANTEPCGAVVLPVNNSCVSQTFDNTGVGSGYNILPSCGNYVGNDLWFTFTVPASGGANVDLGALGMTDSGMSLYTGTDCGNIAEATCDDDGGTGTMSNGDANFPPGTQIWVRVWGYGDDQGTFDICVTETTPAVTASDCGDAINICSNAGFTIDPNGIGSVNDVPPVGSVGNPNSAPSSTNDGCLLAGEKNSTWMIITVGQTGNLEFSFGAGGAQAGFYDWILWPYSGDCGNISAGNVAPVSCNWNASSTGGTGAVSSVPAGGNAGNYEPAIPVVCGQQYLMCFSNYSSASSTVPVEFGGTATVSCSGFINVSSNDITICEGTSGTLNVAGADSYVWSPATGLSATTGNTVTASPTTTTNYTVTGTTGCLTDDTTITVVVEPKPTITTSYTNPSTGANVVDDVVTTCGNEDIVLGASGSVNGYVWFPNAGLSCTTCQNPTVSVGTTNLTYYVVGYSANNCPDTTEFNIIVAPVVSGFNQPVAQCIEGNSFSFTNTGTTGGSYSWDFGDGNTSTLENPTHTYLTASTFTVQQIVTLGSCSDTTELTVTVNPLVEPTFSAVAPLCQNAAAPVLPTTSINAITGTWSPVVSTATAGTQTYIFTPDAGQCADSTTLDITINPLPVPIASADSVSCFSGTDGSVTVTGVTGTSAFPFGYGYSWTPGVQTTQTATGLSVGVYTVTVQDLATTCSAQTTAEIFEPTELTTTITPAPPLCAGQTGSATANPTGGTGAYTYSWDTAPVQTSQTATGLVPGVTYEVTVTDHNNCQVTETVTLVDGVTILAGFSVNDSSQCLTGNNYVLTNTGTSGVTYDWDFGDAGTSTTENPTHGYAGAGTYTITQIAYQGTCRDTVQQVVTVDPMPIPFASADSVLCNGGATGSAIVTSTTNSAGPFTYLWAPGGQTTVNATGLTAGGYTVTVTDQNTGCTGDVSVTVFEPAVLAINPEAHNDPICNGDATG
ncbi:PKD domain-containing protein, partial [Vicingus serpentipes]